jgi:hypothetical protein
MFKKLSRLKVSLFFAVVLAVTVVVYQPLPAFSACSDSLFNEQNLPADVNNAKSQFAQLVKSFKPDDNVDIIFEVPILQKSVQEIENIITDGRTNYFKVTSQNNLSQEADGFSQSYNSVDGEWKKTIKVTTLDPQGRTIVPYIQIFYEDNYGGVVRLKPYGNPNVPTSLSHLRSAHGTLYFKKDPKGDLSWENEAFKVYDLQPLPKSPKEVVLPAGVEFGSPTAEAVLKDCWTFQTHVPLSQQ